MRGFVFGVLARLAGAVFLAACSDDSPDTDELLSQKRAALGLRDEPLELKEAMRRLERYERPLASASADLEGALRIENLLQRARPSQTDLLRRNKNGQKQTDGDIGRLRALLDEARRRARDYARARIDGQAADEALALERSCVDCHQEYQ